MPTDLEKSDIEKIALKEKNILKFFFMFPFVKSHQTADGGQLGLDQRAVAAGESVRPARAFCGHIHRPKSHPHYPAKRIRNPPLPLLRHSRHSPAFFLSNQKTVGISPVGAKQNNPMKLKSPAKATPIFPNNNASPIGLDRLNPPRTRRDARGYTIAVLWGLRATLAPNHD
mgnify:CR=1 FL=1